MTARTDPPDDVAPVRVLVVDDEEITAAAHAEFLRRIGGFEVVGIASTGREAIRLLRPPAAGGATAPPVDLVLLDLTLPDVHGLELCRMIRSAGIDLDVVAITAVRDVAVVRSAVSLGVVQYLIKPFTFATFAERMRSYLEFRAGFDDTTGVATQGEVDRTLARLRTAAPTPLQKGLSEETLDAVRRELRTATTPVSAGELAASMDIARVTARRYLEHLVDAGLVDRSPRYGSPGRPEFEYRWR